MRLLARFDGPNGKISIVEEQATGARHYEEAGVSQSTVLAGGEAAVDYIRLMAALLAGGGDALLLGCGGGALGTMLHRRGASVTVVDVNPISFQLARTFFWMPTTIACVTADMRPFIRSERRRFDVIGVDVGGPRFSYEDVLDATSVMHLRRVLRPHGRIAINISCESPDDPVPARVAEKFKTQGLDVWVFMENVPTPQELNCVILASARRERAAPLAAIGGTGWALARLSSRSPRPRLAGSLAHANGKASR
jgi:SAM-dependent methyltransferase